MLQSKNRKGPVVLCGPDVVFTFPFGIAYVAGALKHQGEDVHVMFIPNHPAGYKDFVNRIEALKPVLVGFGGLYPDLRPIKTLIRELRDGRPSFPIVVGGQMVSPIPEFAVKLTNADYGVIGEAEITVTQLVSALREGADTSGITGLAVRDGDTVTLTGPGEYVHDLSKLPPVPYELFPAEKWLPIGRYYAAKPQPHWRFQDRVVPIHGGRGCPYRCNFCYHPSKPRYRAISEMMEEADQLVSTYNANMLYFGDDLVLGSPQRARRLTEALRQLGRPIEYSISCRFDILSKMDDNLLQEMKATGCRVMGLGIESGSQRILDIMHKKITVEQIKSGLRRLKEVGIVPTVSIMVGQLTETGDDTQASMDLMVESVRENKNIQYAFTVTTPFPGSELYNIALEKGLIKDHDDFYERFTTRAGLKKLPVNFSNMTTAEVEAWRKKLMRRFLVERYRANGLRIFAVEGAQIVSARTDKKIRNRMGSQAGDGLSAKAFRAYDKLYASCQTALDGMRLRLLGIR
jgi:radical SAM superfamily enzyme YgiQ (UPF0313 family)